MDVFLGLKLRLQLLLVLPLKLFNPVVFLEQLLLKALDLHEQAVLFGSVLFSLADSEQGPVLLPIQLCAQFVSLGESAVFFAVLQGLERLQLRVLIDIRVTQTHVLVFQAGYFLLRLLQLVSKHHHFSLLLLEPFLHIGKFGLVSVVELVVVKLSPVELLLKLLLHKQFIIQLRFCLHLQSHGLLSRFFDFEHVLVRFLLLLLKNFGLRLQLALEVLQFGLQGDYFLLPAAAGRQGWVVVVLKVEEGGVLLRGHAFV